MQQLDFDFLLFSRFYGSDYFLNGFPNPFVVLSWPNFFACTKFPFLASDYLFTCSILTLIFPFFPFFSSDFFRICFPDSIISVLSLVFRLVDKNSLNCTSGIVLLCFLIRRLHRQFLQPDFLELTFALNSVTSTALQLKFVCVTSFLLLGQ